MDQAWMFVVTGLLVGVLSGMLGIGGAVVLVPVLVLVFGFTQGRAQGTTIGALVPPIGIFAAMQYYRNGMLDVRVAALIALGFVFGALGGASLVPYVPQIWLKRIFASVLVYVAAELIFQDPKRKVGAVLPGVIAIGLLWIVYAIRKALGKKPKPPTLGPPPPDIEYFI
ncbi:MAG: sulfite exporter TauE/SafE family protein [Polyangiaceae bacterium]|nr:sulfite exporter TauE/SafE family protein [Polyangiaceae bacterium]